MIIAERKPMSDIWKMIENNGKILVLGCGTCVTVCQAGGEKEVEVLASALRMMAKNEGKELETEEFTIERQCEKEFVDEIKDKIDEADAILSLGCGAGVQTIAEMHYDKKVFPALNTTFIGIPEEQGVWSEKCQACGNCILDMTAGICPIARCSKSMLNGPCGGSQNGKCEVDSETDCGWQLIYNRLEALGGLDSMDEIMPPKDWSTSRDGGPRRMVREDLMIKEPSAENGEPKKAVPKKEEPKREESKEEKPKGEKSNVEKPKVEESKVREPNVEGPKMEESKEKPLPLPPPSPEEGEK